MSFSRNHSPKVVIAHGIIGSDDAIGNDILGMHDLFACMGLEALLAAELLLPGLPSRLKTADVTASSSVNGDLLIYHHSIYWKLGEELLERFRGEIIFRYHNVTPSYFFRPYSPVLTQLCEEGVRQTRNLVRQFTNNIWLAASEFSRRELLMIGADPHKVFVIPPFNLGEQFFARARQNGSAVRVLFVGRFVPNKRHRDLLEIAHSYVSHFGNNIEINLVGPVDIVNLDGYVREIVQLIIDLGLRDNVRIWGAVSFEVLRELFRSSSAFLCCSRHEGFCLPVIEAQAAGVPVLGVNAGALAETLGPNQIVYKAPTSPDDYRLFAFTIKELASEGELRERVVRDGYRNVITRFTSEIIENALLTRLLPVFDKLR